MPRVPVERRVIDGCLVFIAPDATLPASCGLVIGRGSADETLARGGWLQVAISDAQAATSIRGVFVQVSVSPRHTTVLLQGAPEQVAPALADLARAVQTPDARELPTRHARLAELPRTRDPLAQALIHRFGIRGLGAAATPLFGTLLPDSYPGLDQDVRRWFARDNCRLFFTFEPPADWTHGLPPGPRLRRAAPDVQVSVPGWYQSPDGPLLSGVVPDQDASRLFGELARRDLLAQFGDERDKRSWALASYRPFSTDQALLALRPNADARALSPRQFSLLLDRVDDWQQGFDPELLAAALAGEQQQLAATPSALQAAQAAAATDLTDSPGEINYHRSRWQQVSQTQLRQIAEQFRESLLLGVPGPAEAKATGLAASVLPIRYVSDLSPRHRSINHPVDERIAAISQGRFWIADEAYPASSVSLTELAVAFRHPDGALTLFDDYGQRVDFDPKAWLEGDVLRRELLAAIDPTKLFEGRERSPAEQQASAPQLTPAGKAAAMTAKRIDEAQFGRRADFTEMLIALSCVLPLAAGIAAIEIFGVSPALAMGLGIPGMLLMLPVVIVASRRRRKRKYRARAEANAAELRKRYRAE